MTSNALKEALLKEYPFKIEMHSHSNPVSPCGEATPTELVDIYADLGYDAITLTNHFIKGLLKDFSKEEALDYYMNAFLEATEQGKKRGITVLLGAELRFNEHINDYLLYGVDREILSKCYDYFPLGLKAFREEVSLPDSLLIQAHPLRRNCEFAGAALLDGIEAFNMHPGHNASIGLAVRLAAEQGLIKTIGSDFHHLNLGHEGVSALRTKRLPEDSFDLVKILKAGDYIFEIGDSSLVLP